MGIEDIIQKFGYNEELSNILRTIYPGLVSRFKDETAVFNALNNVPIVFCTDLYDCLVENDMLGALDEGALASIDIIRDARGGHVTNPQFIYNNETGKFGLQSSAQFVALNTKQIDDLTLTLSHELSHVIKSYNNQYKIDGNTATEYSGFIRREYHLNVVNGVVKRELTSETGVGLEEGLTEIDSEVIYQMATGKSLVSNDYGMTKDVIKKLNNLGIENLDSIILEAEMYHDNARIEELFGQKEFYDYQALLDKVYEQNLEYNDCLTIQDQMTVLKNHRALLTSEYPAIHQAIENRLNNGDMDM